MVKNNLKDKNPNVENWDKWNFEENNSYERIGATLMMMMIRFFPDRVDNYWLFFVLFINWLLIDT